MNPLERMMQERKEEDAFFNANPDIKKSYFEKKYNFEIASDDYQLCMYHHEAVKFCEIMGNGWRVPEPDELLYMFHSGICDPDTYCVSNSKVFVDPMQYRFDYKSKQYYHCGYFFNTDAGGIDDIDMYNAVNDIAIFSFKDGSFYKEMHDGYGLLIPVRDL